MGRPAKPIEWSDVAKLCGLQCTQEEISWFCEVSVDTLERRCKDDLGLSFAEYYAQKRGTGKISLRRKQWEVAMTGDKTMLIWLGKQYLGQCEKVENSLDLTTTVKREELKDKSLDELMEIKLALSNKIRG